MPPLLLYLFYRTLNILAKIFVSKPGESAPGSDQQSDPDQTAQARQLHQNERRKWRHSPRGPDLVVSGLFQGNAPYEGEVLPLNVEASPSPPA
jgi:hypothetical protein